MTAELIQNTITAKLEYLFKEHLPEFTSSDFYELEIASGSIIRGYMVKQCSEKLTMEKKVHRFIETTFKIYDLPKEKIAEAIEFVQRFDFEQIAKATIEFMVSYLAEKKNDYEK